MDNVNGSILTRLEIDVMQQNELFEAMELAFKYNLPAIVVNQVIFADAIIAKIRMGARFKVITPIDWPRGENFGTIKLRGALAESLDTDGFEFMLTPNKNETETANEANAITEFIRQRFPPHVEIRFVLNTLQITPENLEAMCRGLSKVRTPNFIRTDINLKLQQNRANPEIHNALIETIKKNGVAFPLKLCGNFNTLKSTMECDNAARFAVGLSQAKVIIKEQTTPCT